MTPSSQIVDIMVGGGVDDNNVAVPAIVGFTLGTDLFANAVEGSKNEQICLLDTSGLGTDQDDSYFQPTFQVFGRGEKTEGYDDLFDRMEAVKTYLIGLPSVTIDGSRFVGFFIVNEPTPMGPDEKGRNQYTMNFRCYRK